MKDAMEDNQIYRIVATDLSNYKPKDKRLCKPRAFREKKTNETLLMHQLKCARIKRRRIYYSRPNNVALSLSIYDGHIRKARKLYREKLLPHLKKNKDEFSEDVVPELCDYFEHVQTSLVFAYTAVEAFANISIPPDYKYEKPTSRGPVEVYDKKSIERWLPLSEKLKSILPRVLKISPPTSQSFWEHFLKLENLRNSIVHQKTIDDMSAYSEFLNPSIFKIVSSGVKILSYYYNSAPPNRLWPWGLGRPAFIIEEVDKFPLEPVD